MSSLSILPKTPATLLGGKPSAPAAPALPEMREFGDSLTTRRFIYDDALKAANQLDPVTDGTHTLRLHSVDWADPERYTRQQRKNAILTGETLSRRMKGTWELLGPDGQTIQKRQQIVGAVPYMSSMGTFVHRGTEYTVNHQPRLKAGVFARVKDNGELESHVNVLPGKGLSHRYYLDPEKGIFKITANQAEMPLLPLLHAMGATDKEVRAAWGDALYAANYAKNDSGVVNKLAAKFLKRADQASDEPTRRAKLVEVFNRMELDPEVTQRTLGHGHTGVTKEAILAATKKLLAINRGEADPDDRDHLAYQQFVGPEDLFAERLRRDHSGLRRELFYKIKKHGNLDKMPSGALTKQIEQVLLGSGLSQALEEINPAEVLDKQGRITRLGEGGIPSLDAIPDEARNVQPSHLGFMDPIRTPESMRAGVDLQMASGARKGRDGRIYTQLQDKKGQMVWKSPQDLFDAVVATNDALKWDTKRVPAMRGGKLDYVSKDEIDYVVPKYEAVFSPLGNLIPMKSAAKAGRVAMGASYMTQALPVVNGEAPLVRSALPGSNGLKSYEDEFGKHMGAVKASKGGIVEGIKDGAIQVRYEDGTKDAIELYDHHPFNRKTYVNQTPTVQPGQMFKPGQLLARSNFTDDQGVTALGLNLRVAYWPYKGYNFEDAIVVSESAAKRLSSEHMYQHDLEVTDRHKTGRNAFISLFPSKYDRKTLNTLDERGIIKPGSTVEYGQPLILAAKERDRAQNKIHKKRQAGYTDESVVWNHHDSGVVTDVVWGKNGPVVLVKSTSAMQVGDKMSGRYGDKGVVSAIIPDAKMPHGPDGQPFEVLLSPDGTITRTNPVQEIETKLGKIAQKTGKPINVPDFEDIADLSEWADQQLKQHGLKATEDIVWPERNKKIPGISTGVRFLMKLHHTAESKIQGRSSGSYSSDETPAKGGESGSKRLALLDVNALLSHGAVATLHDAGAVRGQKNEERWLQFMSGNTPGEPRVPHTYEKFINQLKGSGINVVRDGRRTHVMAMTNKDVDHLAVDREIKSGDTVRFDHDLRPVPGGLFDEKLTGGHGGKKWSAIKLPEPMPNPVMEEPIRRILGLTQKQFEGVIAGEHSLPGAGTGPKAIAKALAHIDIDRELAKAKAEWKSASAAKRDQAVRRWGYLASAKEHGLEPSDWMLNRVPVLPPTFRPVSVMGDSGIPLVSDANYLYKQMLDASKNFEQMRQHVGDDSTGPERLAIYHSFKAITGLGEPVHPKLVEKGVKGLLKTIFGSSPKFGTVQRKLISSTVDDVGRSVITPNPDFDIDTIGLPENQAFTVYQRSVVRRLRRRGLPIREALRHVKDRTPLAREMLTDEMEARPVFVNRAPVLHKFGIMAFRPKLVSGNVLQISPLVVKGFNADFDGDAMQFHVPGTEAAVAEAYERLLPSKSLLSPSDFKSPMHVPGQQYQAGLYHATRIHEHHKKTRPRVFRDIDDARQAHARGEITADTPVEIINA